MKKVWSYLTLPFCYLIGVILLLYYLPSMIRDLQKDEQRYKHFYH